ncbi:MAG: HEAT repeat domain-containing protein [Leptospira sp.]|nr:HEAT repeat domain-containing protein [Leptospira sp.]
MRMALNVTLVLLLVSCSGPPEPKLLPVPVKQNERSLDEIEKDLKSETWSIRSQAIVEATNRNYKKLIPVLRKLLKEDSNAAVRASAALALGSFQDKESTLSIAGMIQNDKAVEADTILDALARMKDSRGASVAIPFLESENLGLRLQAVESLVQMNARSSGDKILAVAKKNTDPDKAKTFAMAFGQLEVKSAEGYLLGLAENSDPSPTLAATYLALGKIKSKKAIPVLSKAISSDFPKGRENSVEALINIRDTAALNFMYPYLSDKSKEIAYSAATVISGIPSHDAGRQTLMILEKGNQNSFGPCAYVLGRIKYEPARQKLETIFQNQNVPEREEIGRSFGWLGNRASVPVLLKVLEEKDGEGRYGAAWSLGVLEAEEALDGLIKASASKDRKLAAISVESLGMLHSAKAIPALKSKMESEKSLAAFVVGALVAIPGEESRKLLEEYALNDDPIIYKPAIQAIAQKKDRLATPTLIQLLKSDKIESHRLVINALISVTGKRFDSKNEWLNWYTEEYK